MSDYFLGTAQRHRLYASLTSISTMADAINLEEDFDPTEFIKMLDNINGELVFLNQYVTHNFLQGEGNPTLDQVALFDPDEVK